MRIRTLINRLSFAENLLFPPKCENCGALLDVDITKRVDAPLCEPCRLLWEREKTSFCSSCGLSLSACSCMPKAMKKAQCSALLKLVSYRASGEMPTKRFVLSLKHSHNKASFSFIAEQMRFLLISEMKAKGLLPDDCVITYLPRSLVNRNSDGFDQGYLLAKSLSRITGIRLVECFKRRVFVKEQKQLNSFERRLNMQSAFKLGKRAELLENKTVILVDDIVTTGSGMASCARLCYSAGAYDVVGICVGFTEKDKK